jgi:hypothetical protein
MAGSIEVTQNLVEAGLPSLVGSIAGGLRLVVKTSVVWTSAKVGTIDVFQLLDVA